MKRLLAVNVVAMLLFAGCAAPTMFDVKNDSISSMSGNHGGTYSSYGGKIEFNNEDKHHHLTVYVGGLGSCDNGAILYAQPKLDDFMKTNGFASYNIVKGEYTFFPLSKCELFVQFIK